ncbi:MAG: D-alanyl-D-alanine carboxypeptidase, partial [Nonomuraea sp.]|nr:D-alanyl-D-alanine carboxypeptidase [Nonomuraea sp.]
KLLWRYQGMIGVKNGWTSKAQGSFVGAATRGGHTILVTIMRHEGYFWDEVAKLLDWGFSVRGKVAPVGQLVEPVPEQRAAPQVTAPVSKVTPAAQPPLLDTAASKQTDTTRTVGSVVIGGGLLFGLIWLGYGIRRKRGRSRL